MENYVLIEISIVVILPFFWH